MKKQLLVFIGSGLLATASMAASIQEVEQSKLCSSVTFELSANLSTGYSWQVIDYNQTRFKKKKESYEAPDKKLIGSGGKMKFSFSKVDKEDSAKEAVFLLAYGQAWNKQSYENTVILVKFTDKPCKQ